MPYSGSAVNNKQDSLYKKKALGQIAVLIDTSIAPAHIKIASNYLGLKENKGNKGNVIDFFLESVGAKPNSGWSWCAGFVRKVMDLAKVTYPTKRTGMAQGYKTDLSIKATDVLSGNKSLKDGWYLVIWAKGKTTSGHIGFLVVRKGNLYYTIEGNTSSGERGSQSNGDMVAFRKRYIEPLAYMRIIYFTPIRY